MPTPSSRTRSTTRRSSGASSSTEMWTPSGEYFTHCRANSKPRCQLSDRPALALRRLGAPGKIRGSRERQAANDGVRASSMHSCTSALKSTAAAAMDFSSARLTRSQYLFDVPSGARYRGASNRRTGDAALRPLRVSARSEIKRIDAIASSIHA